MNRRQQDKFRKKVTEDFNLFVDNPFLADQWHPTRNGALTARDVTPRSHKKVWWYCEKGHEWAAEVKTRANGVGCPYCAGKAVSADNCLAVINPDLSTVWHPSKNGDLTPADVRPNTHRVAWWRCNQGHDWEAAVANRFRGSGCPYCAGKLADRKTNLVAVNPEVAAEWHATRNGRLKPSRVTANSGKRVWWQCAKGHEWQTTVRDRNAGTGCPYCANRKVDSGNSLAASYPELAQEWHPTRNRSLTPLTVTPGSSKAAHWKCAQGHVWQARISARTRGAACPACSGRVPTRQTSLKAVNKAVATEWHPTRNRQLKPKDVLPGSNKKVWWRCRFGHEWKAVVSSRSAGTGCPHCSPQTSKIELRVYTELKTLFPDSLYRKKLFGVECDVYVPSLRLAVEVDGSYWHREKQELDTEKMRALERRGRKVIRIREEGLEKISEHDVVFDRKTSDAEIMRMAVGNILTLMDAEDLRRGRLEAYAQKGELVGDRAHRRLMSRFPAALPGRSLADKAPELAAEWHPRKNGKLTASDVASQSNRSVWWRCAKGHAWEAQVNNRFNGSGCPYCRGQAVDHRNSLQAMNPTLAAEWDGERNLPLTAQTVRPKSSRLVWWRCGRGHGWQDTVISRSRGKMCPGCAQRKAGRRT